MPNSIYGMTFHRLDGVRLSTQGLNGHDVSYHKNIHKVHNGVGEFASHAITCDPGDPVKICLRFCQDFELQGASGVRVTVALGHTEQDPSDLSHSQSWWIDASNLKRRHVFEFISTWESEDDDAPATPTRITIPVPDDNPAVGCQDVMWKETGIANKGCIAIFVARGHLTDETAFRALHPTDPPPSHRWKPTGMPKVISRDWFKESSEAIVFELRNMIQPDAADTDDADDVDEEEAIESPRGRSVSPIEEGRSTLSEQEAIERALRESSETIPQSERADSAIGGSGDETLSGDEMNQMERAIRASVEPMPGSETAASATGGTGDETLSSDQMPGVEMESPTPRRRQVRGRKRKAPPQSTAASTSKKTKDAAAPKGDLKSLCQLYNSMNEDEDDEEALPAPSEPTPIKREPAEVIDLTQDDEDETVKIKQEMLESNERAEKGEKAPTMEQLRFELQESKAREGMHHEKMIQAQIQKQMSAMDGELKGKGKMKMKREE